MSVDEKKLSLLKKRQRLGETKLENILIRVMKGQKTVLGRAKTVDVLTSLVGANIFLKPSSAADMAEFKAWVDKLYNFGLHYVDTTPPEHVKLMSDIVQEKVMGFVSKMGDDIKDDALKIVSDGVKQDLLPYDISKQLIQQLDISQTRAKAIARTETMRASNTASFLQAKENGNTHFVVDNREEACEECVDEYEGQVFTIGEDDGELPPLHVNCACVAVYFNNQDDASEWSDQLQTENKDQRIEIEDKQGFPIPTDGTGQYPNTPEPKGKST